MKTDQEYEALYHEAKSLAKEKRKIIGELKQNGFINETSEDIGSSLGVVFKEDLNNYPNTLIQNYIHHAGQLCEKFEIFHTEYQQENLFDIARQKATRKAERDDHWKLWFQKFIRWTAGIFGAVILYSTLVALSDWFSFIKIPVRDLVVGNG